MTQGENKAELFNCCFERLGVRVLPESCENFPDFELGGKLEFSSDCCEGKGWQILSWLLWIGRVFLPDCELKGGRGCVEFSSDCCETTWLLWVERGSLWGGGGGVVEGSQVGVEDLPWLLCVCGGGGGEGGRFPPDCCGGRGRFPLDCCKLGGGSDLIAGIEASLRSADSWRLLCGWSPCSQWPPCLLPPPPGSQCSVRPPRPPRLKYKQQWNRNIYL